MEQDRPWASRFDEPKKEKSMKRLKTWHLLALAIALPILYYSLPALGIGLGNILLFLLVLACPLFHLLGMHGAHGHGGHARGDEGGSGTDKLPAPQAEGEGAGGKLGP
jgi:hypothetical protein